MDLTKKIAAHSQFYRRKVTQIGTLARVSGDFRDVDFIYLSWVKKRFGVAQIYFFPDENIKDVRIDMAIQAKVAEYV